MFACPSPGPAPQAGQQSTARWKSQVWSRGRFVPISAAGQQIIMARPRPEAFKKVKTVAENRRARFDYAIDEVFEAGIVLQGTEVKSLRFGEGSIAESYAEVKDEQVWLINSNIPEFSHGNRYNHEPKRPRKLLLHQREIAKLHGAVARKGMTLVPLSIYFNGQGRAKVELALAKGKNAADKRETTKEREWKREQGRLLKEHG